MIISFLGKGGSGKSSLATQVALQLGEENQVLAIDADHNMDFAYNLCAGEPPEMNYLGSGLPDVLEYVGLSKNEKYTKAFLEDTQKRFRFGANMDTFTDSYTHKPQESIHLMSSGPQTDKVLYGSACSHFLSTPLKVYLPLLELDDNAFTILDEKAGADGASTGIVTGVDVGVIVAEPSVHSVKTANQIADLLQFFDTPYVFVGNKISDDEDTAFLNKNLQSPTTVCLPNQSAVKRDPFTAQKDWKLLLSKLMIEIQDKNNNDRLERTVVKFQRNSTFT